ncbi:MAG: adenosylcobinamide-GDP ribazoletransferase [Candidatus Omnitrophica bacterium]|nr:adenosylcobinamide-GDP ribazoletransferase [Candidatus Omnitrophota bacterium]
MISDLLSAIRFLTILPLPRAKKETDLAKAMFFFPLVGILIGILTLAITRVLSLDIFGQLEALSFITLPIFLTGGLHVDGFADFCDGFFGGRDKEEILKIMRDPRSGVWGILGVALLVVWKWQLLASMSRRTSALFLCLTASRWSQVVLAYFLPYGNPSGGLGEKVAKKIGPRELIGASSFFGLIVFFLGANGLVTLLALIPFLAGVGFLFYKRIGGITGDLIGATSEAVEVFVLFILFLVRSGNLK